ncbi:hypothetical protein [Nocardia sienata]|uniref:hypothetical protein n=1 Tax=Nocardia sienata TaxID=248552 RepID=UPI0012EDE763|nr:hypothetical protein [Nocardia sienata]
MAERSQSRRITNLTIGHLAWAMSGSGVALLLASSISSEKWAPWSAFVSQLGGLLLATGLVTLAWEQWGRRNFTAEVMEIANLGTDLQNSGIKRVTDQYLSDVVWSDLFADVQKLDIVVAYASTWRNIHRGRIIQAATNPSARIRVFLPHPDDDATMSNLAQRFSITTGEIRAKVREAITDFRSMSQPGGAQVEVWLRKGDLLYSCYRFGTQRAVVTLYSHTRERQTSVPTFVVDGGSLFTFVYRDIEAIRAQSELAP